MLGFPSDRLAVNRSWHSHLPGDFTGRENKDRRISVTRYKKRRQKDRGNLRIRNVIGSIFSIQWEGYINANIFNFENAWAKASKYMLLHPFCTDGLQEKYIFPLEVGKFYISQIRPLPGKPGSDAISLYSIPKILSSHWRATECVCMCCYIRACVHECAHGPFVLVC